MKNLFYLSLIIIASVLTFSKFNSEKQENPAPVNGETQIKEGEEEGNQDKRSAWFDLLHQAAPGANWKAIEYQTSIRRSEKRKALRSQGARGDQEVLANGTLFGKWLERGSANQSGSVFVPEYDPETELIYIISAGGTLFRGDKSGFSWEVINQDLRFNTHFLEFIEGPNGKRLLAFSGDHPHFSDDLGYTWTKGSGIPVSNKWANSKNTIVLKEAGNLIYTLSKPGYWDNYGLYKSTDLGETYTELLDLGSSETNDFAMVNPHHTNDIYLIKKNGESNTEFYKLDQNEDALDLINATANFGFGSARANLIGTMDGDDLKFFTYIKDGDNNDVYTSIDLGATWIRQGYMEDSPWSVGMYVSPTDPDFLMMGAVDCARSLSGGVLFSKVNGWAEYYSDPVGKLHADMMHFEEFENADGSTFLLNSNHGGLYITTNKYATVRNISLYGLNVSQYYDVVSLASDPNIIFAGSQDQGFQRTTNQFPDNIADFDQVISGDYGHIVFTKNEDHMWMVYPGGWVTYYNNPMTGLSSSWQLDSETETVWIPPLMPSPDPTENAIYLAGGNMEGESGSYLIKLEYNPALNAIDTSQIDFDFLDNSAGGTISMMKTSPVNPNLWYVATTNGRFFNSYDAGQTWDQTVSFIPDGHYLYGASIYASTLEENVVYMAGSGYSNPAVYKSFDNGENFIDMSDGLPSTLVFEITANADESLFFAATEAGPYVYKVEDEKWYDMSGLAAPNQTYWSVEYLPSLDRVRFGTYGRGIWDFQIEEEEISSLNNPAEFVSLNIFPNPSTEVLNITVEKLDALNVQLEIFDTQGKRLIQNNFINTKGVVFNEQINISALSAGNYFLKLSDGRTIHRTKFVKL